MNPIDALLAILLLPFVLNGWRRGLCREGFALHGLGGVDRFAGTAFGVLKGAACLGLILILLDRLMPSTAMQMAIGGSLLGPHLIGIATSLLDMGRELSSTISRL